MELFLQFGNGMMEHCRCLLKHWNGGAVVLSPRDIEPDRMVSFGKELAALANVQIYLDPQFYVPHGDHRRLCSHPWWPKDYDSGLFWQSNRASALVKKLHRVNAQIETSALILPGLVASSVDEHWLATQEAFLSAALSLNLDMPVIPTLALSEGALADQDQIDNLLESISDWDVGGYYIVCEHPRGSYLVADPIWMANLLDLVAGIKLRGRTAIIGYCSHQQLLAGLVRADAICSGTWMNVRAFPPEKFRDALEDETKRRGVWYYCPQALSEFNAATLDVAHRNGVLHLLQDPENSAWGRLPEIFSGPRPTTVGLSEQDAFRHYLNCLHSQCRACVKKSFDETVAAQLALLQNSESLLESLHEDGVRGRHRDFLGSSPSANSPLDANRDALTIINKARGPVLRRNWRSLK